MRVRVPGPRPSRPRPALAAPVAPPLTSGPAPSSARNAGAAPLGRRASERASERRRDPAGGWGLLAARLRSLPSGSRGRGPAPPPGKMALHFQVSALCAAGPRCAAPGTRRHAAGLGTGGRGRRRRPRHRGRRAPGTRALAWAAHRGPGPDGGAARARGRRVGAPRPGSELAPRRRSGRWGPPRRAALGGAQALGSRPRLRGQPTHSWDGARERPWVRRRSGASGWTLIGQSGPGPRL